MRDRPEFLAEEHARAFDDADAARAYRYRQSYPPQVFDVLRKLLAGQPGRVLDLGCGTGFIARTLIRDVGRVDAVDASREMIEAGRSAPGGRDRGIRWMVGKAEEIPLAGPYGLAVAGDSLHWMDWDAVLPRLARAMAPGAFLAIVVSTVRTPWQDELTEIVRRFSRNPSFDPDFALEAELERRGLWARAGATTTDPVARRQKVPDWIESFHGMSSLTRRRLGKDAFAFDDALRGLARRHGASDIDLTVTATITWGTPRTA